MEKNDAEKSNAQQNKPKKRKWLRILLIVLASIVGLLLLVAVVAVIFLNGLLNKMNRTPDTYQTLSPSQMEQFMMENTDELDPNFTGEILDEEDIEWGTVKVDPIPQGNHIINFLLIGKDRASSGYSRTDTMILCTINKSTKQITLTSFMRDLYLKLPNGYSNRINASYVFGGVNLLKQTVEETFGVTVHGTFEVDFSGFKDVINMVGGVQITLSASEANYMNKYVQNPTRSFVEGTYLLDGNEALTYARMRQVGAGDFTRTERQRQILELIYNKCKDMSATELYKLMEKVLPLVTTNLTNGQIMSYAAQLIPILSKMDFNAESRIPADGTYKMVFVNKMSVLVADLDANRKLLEEIMAP